MNKESKFVWCEKHEQWRARELKHCRGCGRGTGPPSQCVLKPQVKKKRVARKKKV